MGDFPRANPAWETVRKLSGMEITFASQSLGLIPLIGSCGHKSQGWQGVSVWVPCQWLCLCPLWDITVQSVCMHQCFILQLSSYLKYLINQMYIVMVALHFVIWLMNSVEKYRNLYSKITAHLVIFEDVNYHHQNYLNHVSSNPRFKQ